MSNFVRVDGQIPVNMDLVETFSETYRLGWYSIEFTFTGSSEGESWNFRGDESGVDVFLMLLSNYTTTLNP